MKLIVAILILQLLVSCNNADNARFSKVQQNTSNTGLNHNLSDQTFTVNAGIILKDYSTWYNYSYRNVRLSQDFIGLDIDSVNISKAVFLKKLMTGKVVAFLTMLRQGVPVYKLFNLNPSNESIKSTIIQLASIETRNSKMEGKQLPGFSFTDIYGNVYTNASTKGKILVLKCWFIHCVACVLEFPECNKLVEENKDRNNIFFIGLSSDSKEDLVKFLTTTKFKYITIPGVNEYITAGLDINEYPTHLLIDKTGKIIKVVNSIEELIPFLKKELEK